MSYKETETRKHFDKVKVGDMLCVYTKRQYHGDNFFDRLKDCPVTCVSKNTLQLIVGSVLILNLIEKILFKITF